MKIRIFQQIYGFFVKNTDFSLKILIFRRKVRPFSENVSSAPIDLRLCVPIRNHIWRKGFRRNRITANKFYFSDDWFFTPKNALKIMFSSRIRVFFQTNPCFPKKSKNGPTVSYGGVVKAKKNFRSSENFWWRRE